jgi:iron complex outermembrane receptor protein
MPPFSSVRSAVRICLLLCAALAASSPWAQPRSGAGLAELSLEELSELPVTSVSGRPESLSGAPASVFVISGEDIRRSAATSLPEALRLAPNLQVARLSSGQYAISARGFNNAIANKLLVLIDGRTIYSTLFSGVFWDFHDLVLEDIERIEVISGPGGTLWGANAVNGIINVITKPAAATQGTLLSVTRSGHGGQESARWGGKLGETGYLRIYTLALDRGATRRPDGASRDDANNKAQAGFRAEQLVGQAHLTVQGDLYRGGDADANTLAPKLHGGNLLARWEDRFANGSPYRVQAYYDLQARDERVGFRNRAETVDLQFAHEPQLRDGHQLLWGAGYRLGKDRNDPSAVLLFVPAQRRLTWANIFAQHQLRKGAWQWTTGAKLERNSYTGTEFLPNVRLAYEHGALTTTWAAWSRTVRAPARLDRELFFPGTPPFFIAAGPDFQSEIAKVLELGHRGQFGRNLSYSATLFRQHYEGLRGGLGTPLQITNRIEGDVDGLESWAQAQPAEWMRFTLGYLRLRQDLRFSNPPADTISLPALGNDPRSQWSLRSQFDLPGRTELDLQVRHVGALPSPTVPAYTVADARLGWQLTSKVEVSLLAQNLTNRRHVEFNAPANASVFGRRLFLRVVCQL